MVTTENYLQDHALRQEALDIRRSFIVQAPAGSGKTGLLTLRYLRLLSSLEKEPEECLALTFTRKAALEMKERILHALKSALNDTPPTDPYEFSFWQYARAALKQDKTRAWNLLLHPERLKIQTIDAFLAGLVRQMPILSGLGTDFSISENAQPFYNEAARYLLKNLEHKTAYAESLRCLLSHLDNNLAVIERLLAEMLANREQWLPYVMSREPIEASRIVLERGLQAVILETLQHLMQHLPNNFQEILNLAEFAASVPGQFVSGLSATLDDLPKWLSLSKLLLTQNATLRKTVTKAEGFPAPVNASTKEDKAYYKLMKMRMENVLSDLEKNPEFIAGLIALRACPAPQYDESQWLLVKALLRLLPYLVAELMLIFQRENQVDFIEILLAASRALGAMEDPSDLTLKLDYKIRHILVDEFQDTSIPQWRLLEKLTAGWQPGDGRTLFLVGDPMQSIYRFRRAEVGLFIKAKTRGLGDIHLNSLTLSSNFRSDKVLVDWVNHQFKMRFPKEENMALGAITFNASIASQKGPNLNAVIEHTVSDINEEAEYVSTIIQDVKAQDKTGSIALLVRSRSHLKAILPLLKEKKIAYQGVQLSLLKERSIVQDLMSLTRALLHFEDRIAWLAILRAPWAALSLSDLLLIAQYNVDMPLWWTLERYAEILGLSAMAKATLNRIVPVLAAVLQEAGRLSLRDAVMQAWRGFGYGYSLQDEANIKDAETYLALLENSQPEHVLYKIGELESRLQTLYASTEIQDNSILQIMTIHKAKGLEFDTVIVAGLGRNLKKDTDKLLLWEERTSEYSAGQLILAPIKSSSTQTDPIYQYLKQQVQKRAAFEADRLLYVAATRAKKCLHWISYKIKLPK